MRLRERYTNILHQFEQENPNPETELLYDNPFQLLVAVVLSAQCTDKRVNLVTPILFEAYPNPKMMSQASKEDIFDIIKSISYPNNKAGYLVKTAQILVEAYKGELPTTLEELVKLPGVGRKTANVILSVLYQNPNMAVDTHVFRVSHRLGLVSKKEKTVLAVEKKLVKYIPKEKIYKAHHWLILHGRYVCLARKPLCEKCILNTHCKMFTEQKRKLN